MAQRPGFLSEAQRRHSQRHLKVCPLCEALNSAKNGDCFVCGWHGDFIQNADAIEYALIDLIEQSPELYAAVQRNLRQPTLLQRARHWLRRPLDLWA